MSFKLSNIFAFLKNETFRRLVVLICRLFLGCVFTYSGFMMTIDPVGNSYRVEDFLRWAGLDFFLPVSFILAVLYSAYVFFVGVCLLLGANLKSNAMNAFVLLVLVSVGLCFGGGVAEDTAIEPSFDLLTKDLGWSLMCVAVAATLCLWNRFNWSLYTDRTEWTISIYSFFYAVLLSFYSLFFLPIIDLRPFAIGSDLSGFVKGLKVERKETRIYDYFEEVGHGEAEKKSGIDDSGYLFLLVTNNIGETNTDRRNEINDIYDFSRKNGYGFYALTASPLDCLEMREYKVEAGGAEYPFVAANNDTLLSMVRSNPGLLLLKDGVVYNKWGNADMPKFKEPLDGSEAGEMKKVDDVKIVLNSVAIFVLPLVLVLIFDYFIVFLKFLFGRFFHVKSQEPEGEEKKS